MTSFPSSTLKYTPANGVRRNENNPLGATAERRSEVLDSMGR